MDEKTTKLIKERYDALPESIKEVIVSSNYEEILVTIGKQYNLNVEQMGILEVETTLTMMGLTPTKDFENELTRELNIDKIRGGQIVKDINEKIFLKIRGLLKLMNTPAGEEPSLEETTEGKNTDTQILGEHGIEIISNKAEEPKMGDVHPILAQKLSGPMQMPSVKTEHTLDNLTKTNAPAPAGVETKIPNVDPYREKPE